MNLDELVESISESDLKAQLSHWIEGWKADDSDIEKLSAIIDKWYGNVWFTDRQSQSEFYKRFQKFREEAIRGIGGMTVNERLYWFGLFDHWDNSDGESRDRIRAKLRADA
jgi:hypothetical protein